MLKLSSMFTQYKLSNILSMKSKYSPRIYEIFKCNEFRKQGFIEIEVEGLRKLIKADEVYPKYNDFKRYVIERTQKELKKLSDLSFEFEEIKTGRKVTSLKFCIYSNKSKGSKESPLLPIDDEVTNLTEKEFPAEKIKEIYHLRWGIETSFRELKYAIGLTSFHSKKAGYILQEIFARLTMYNFCEIITTHVVIQQTDRKYSYQVNFTMAISICLYYFKCTNAVSPPNVEALIQKNILPVRNGRKDPRKVRTKSSVSFIYRVA